MNTSYAQAEPAATDVKYKLEAEAGMSPKGVTVPRRLYSRRHGAHDKTIPSQTIYIEIDLGIRDNTNMPRKMTGIFIPRGFRPGPTVDVLVYLHGHNNQVADFFWDVHREPNHPFRELLNQSGKNVILVVPSLGWRSEAGRLTRPGGFDAYMDQVVAAIHAYAPSLGRPRIGNIILAGHSGGGKPLRQIASGGGRYAALIRECWGFDCTYSSGDPQGWAQWARSHPAGRVFIYYHPRSRTTTIFSNKLKQMRIPNAIVQASRSGGHGKVPMHHWIERLRGAPFLRDIGSSQEVSYENWEAGSALEAETGSIQDFRERVLRTHIARQRRPALPNLLPAQVARVEGTNLSMRRDAAVAAGRLIAAANRALQEAKGARNPDALRTIRASATSGYRDRATQERIWRTNFARRYYPQTATQRTALRGGPHGQEAVNWMAIYVGKRVAAPGYSNHQAGTAIDLWQQRTPGNQIPNSTDPDGKRRWRGTWLYNWLRENARQFGFVPYAFEPWHWTYNPSGAIQRELAPEVYEGQESEC